MAEPKAPPKRNVAITGLTAAGKTTHARITMTEFTLGYVSGSTILLEKAGFTADTSGDFWLSATGQDLSHRIIELGIDEALRDAEMARDETVFDCRSLPWLAHNSILSIWLESSLESRVWKAIVSYGRNNRRTVADVREEIVRKDELDRDNLRQAFGFDLFRDYEPMDLIINLSDFISAPSVEASWRSIQLAQDIISNTIGLYFTNDDFYRIRLHRLQENFGPSVFRRYSPRFTQMLNG
jgi:cytidylate kinase